MIERNEECLICKAPLEYLNEDIEMEKSETVCQFSSKNNQCLGHRCPFSKVR